MVLSVAIGVPDSTRTVLTWCLRSWILAWIPATFWTVSQDVLHDPWGFDKSVSYGTILPRASHVPFPTYLSFCDGKMKSSGPALGQLAFHDRNASSADEFSGITRPVLPCVFPSPTVYSALSKSTCRHYLIEVLRYDMFSSENRGYLDFSSTTKKIIQILRRIA